MKRLDWNALDETARREALARPAQARADELKQGVAKSCAFCLDTIPAAATKCKSCCSEQPATP